MENYVFNLLSQRWNTQFFRKGNFEVDFIFNTPRSLLPIEVKYQETVRYPDYKNIIKLAKTIRVARALLVSKNVLRDEIVEGVTLHIIPAPLLEFFFAQKSIWLNDVNSQPY